MHPRGWVDPQSWVGPPGGWVDPQGWALAPTFLHTSLAEEGQPDKQTALVKAKQDVSRLR